MKTYTIPQKISGSGSIHDIESDLYERDIRFPKNHIFAVVLAAYYGGKGYSVHRTQEAAVKKALALNDYSYVIINDRGDRLVLNFDGLLVKTS